MIDFNGTKIDNNNKLIVNASVIEELDDLNHDIYENVYLKNIKVYTADSYPENHLIDADNISVLDSTSGEIVTIEDGELYKTTYTIEQKEGQEAGQSIVLGSVKIDDNRSINVELPRTIEALHYEDEGVDEYKILDLYRSQRRAFEDVINEDRFESGILNSVVEPVVLQTRTERKYLAFKVIGETLPNSDSPVYLNVDAIYFPLWIFDAFSNNFSFYSSNLATGYNYANTNISMQYLGQDLDTNITTIFGIPITDEDIVEEHELIESYTQKSYEHIFKDLRSKLNTTKCIDFKKEFLIVEANVYYDGTPAETTPCGKDLTKEICVIYNKNLLFKQAMGYLKSLGGCEPSKEFIDFILRLKSLELSTEACNYLLAAYIWNWFANNDSNPCGVKVKSNCNCHG